MTSFNDTYDSLIYSDLFAKGIALSPGIKRGIDLGAGSSVPALLALKHFKGALPGARTALAIRQGNHA